MPTIKTKIAFLRELLALKEIIDAGQIQAAAERNGIKYSNMSKMIQDLESRFKTSLLIRSSSGSLPTNTTRQIYADIEHISDALDNIIQSLTEPDELTGYISIWATETFAGSGFFTEMAKLYAKHPKIRLDIFTDKNINVTKMDIAMLDSVAARKHTGIPLFNIKAKKHFFASKVYIEKHGMPKNIDDMLENYDLCIRQKILEQPEFNFIAKRAKKLNTTTDSEAVLYLLANDGAGITLMPNWAKNKNDNLVEINTIDFEYEYVLTAVGNPLTTKTPKVRTFIEFLCEFCRDFNIDIERFI